MLHRIWHLLVIAHFLKGFLASRESEDDPVVLESSHGREPEVQTVLTSFGDSWQRDQQNALLESSPLPTPADTSLQTIANASAPPGRQPERCSGKAIPIAMTIFVVAFVCGNLLIYYTYEGDVESDIETRHEITIHDLQRAVHFMLAAIGAQRNKNHVRNTNLARSAYWIENQMRPYMIGFSFAVVVVSFLESPAWCVRPDILAHSPMACYDKRYPSWRSQMVEEPMFAETSAMNFEVLCIVGFAVHLGLLAFAQGRNFFDPWGSARFALVVIYMIDLIYASVVPPHLFRLGPYLRILFIPIYSPIVYDTTITVMRAIPAVFAVVALLILVLFFFARTASMVFTSGIDKENYLIPMNFADLYSSMWALYVLFTKEIYPDLMMVAYTSNRFYFIFFFIWVVIASFILLPITMALVYSAYAESREEKEVQKAECKAESLKGTYQSLQIDGHIEQSDLRRFFAKLQEFYHADDATQQELDRKIHEHYTDNFLDEAEFDNLLEVFWEHDEYEPPPPLMERLYPALQQNQCWLAVQAYVKDGYMLDLMVDCFLVLTIIYSFVNPGEVMGLADLASLVVFTCEALLKITTLGFRRYWMQIKNRFDFCVTLLTIVAALYIATSSVHGAGSVSPKMIVTVSTIRAARLTGLLSSIPGFQPFVYAFKTAVPQTAPICVVMFCATYLYGVLGMELYGGKIFLDAKEGDLEWIKETEYGKSNYYANNFNDLPSAMVVLFEVIITNGWWVHAEGYYRTCGTWGPMIYFVSFFWLGALIMMNLLVACFVDVVITSSAENREID